MINISQIQKKYKLSYYRVKKLIELNNIQPIQETEIIQHDMISLTKYPIIVKYYDPIEIEKYFTQ